MSFSTRGKRRITKEYVCEQFGNQHTQTLTVLDTRINGKWVFAYIDVPENHEYGLKLIPHVADAVSITVWFADPISRKNFMLTLDTDSKMEQLNPGMVFNHLEGKETQGKYRKMMRMFFSAVK